ncbi:porin [Alphaproteobacteria bacterium]|nr:porin [Alphaproteobacteria bacterium]
MNKFLITLVAAMSLLVANIASADVKISGMTGALASMGDKVDGGITSKFNRFQFTADATMDNGWTYSGFFATEIVAAGTRSFALPTSNGVSIGTGFATISIGSVADAATALVPRIGAMVPGGGHDAGYQFLSGGDTKWGASGVAGQVGFAEAYYAYNASRINVALPSVNGFTVNASYTPAMDMNEGAGNARTNNKNSNRHGETTHIAAAYAGEMDGMSYTIAAASISGNSEGNPLVDQTLPGNNNDLTVFTAAVKVSMGNITVGAHMYDNGDSFGAANDADKAANSGYTVSMEYGMGNITLGIGIAHQEKTMGTRAATADTKAGVGVAGNVYEDDITMFGVGYNMGGGVNSFVQYNAGSVSDGNHVTVADKDPSVLSMGITLGF